MFDVGFSELFFLAIIALVVLGPEKLPEAARTAGRWYAKIRFAISNVQEQIESEFNVAETRRQMQAEIEKVRKIEANMQAELDKIRANIDQTQNLDEMDADALYKNSIFSTDEITAINKQYLDEQQNQQQSQHQNTEDTNTDAISPSTQHASDTNQPSQTVEQTAINKDLAASGEKP